MRLLLASGVLLLLGCSSEQAPVVATPDDVPPVVTLTAPGAGAVVSGQVTLTATASDDEGIVGVQFKIDGVNLGSEDRDPPYTYNWNTLQGDNATHTIAAGARDFEGNGTTTPAITVSVVNPTTSSIRVETTTTGADFDADGYTVTIGSVTVTASANQSLIVPDLPRGNQPVHLTGVADNCTLVGPAETSVFVSLEGVSAVTFQVRCSSLTSPAERIVWRHQSPVDAVTPALFSINGDGTGKRLSRDDNASNPEWSQDRTRVYFRSERAGAPGPGIYWYDEALGSESFEASLSALDPTTPPDRLGLAYMTAANQVYVLINGVGINYLAVGAKPAWAPSADAILFVVNGNIWVAASRTTDRNQVIAGGSSPRWSPNGSKILFWRDQGSGVGSYWIANADGTGQVLVVQGTFLPDDGASWSPNGRQFVYSSTAGGQSNLWVINIDGTGATNITNGTGETNIQPTWFR